MMRTRIPIVRLAAALTLALAAGPAAAADGVLAVLSAGDAPYMEALDGLQAGLNHPVKSVRLTGGGVPLPPGTRVVVAIGGDAAVRAYPEHVAVIICLAPGVDPRHRLHRGNYSYIDMFPRADSLVRGFKEVQPSAARIAVFWTSEAMREEIENVKRSGAEAGLQIVSRRISGADELPDSLRKLEKGIDAIWLPPDPRLVNPRAFELLKDFSWSTKVPFYAPTTGLVERGAVASFSSSYRAMGLAAANAARAALSGGPLPPVVYPDQVETAVNLPSAAQAGLSIPEPAVRNASRVVR